MSIFSRHGTSQSREKYPPDYAVEISFGLVIGLSPGSSFLLSVVPFFGESVSCCSSQWVVLWVFHRAILLVVSWVLFLWVALCIVSWFRLAPFPLGFGWVMILWTTSKASPGLYSGTIFWVSCWVILRAFFSAGLFISCCCISPWLFLRVFLWVVLVVVLRVGVVSYFPFGFPDGRSLWSIPLSPPGVTRRPTIISHNNIIAGVNYKAAGSGRCAIARSP